MKPFPSLVFTLDNGSQDHLDIKTTPAQRGKEPEIQEREERAGNPGLHHQGFQSVEDMWPVAKFLKGFGFNLSNPFAADGEILGNRF